MIYSITYKTNKVLSHHETEQNSFLLLLEPDAGCPPGDSITIVHHVAVCPLFSHTLKHTPMN